MKQALSRFIYHRLLGWKAVVGVPDFKKCIFCAAPHTTNWDLFIGKLFINAIGRKSGFLMKKRVVLLPAGRMVPEHGGHTGVSRQAYVDGRPAHRPRERERRVPPRHHAGGHALCQPQLETGLLLHRAGGADSHRAGGSRLRAEVYHRRALPHPHGRCGE